MYTLTNTDVTALRQADDLCVYINNRYPNGLVRLIKRKQTTPHRPFDGDLEHTIAAPVVCRTYDHRDVAAQCFAMITFYRHSPAIADTIIRSLRAGDEVTFVFVPDGYSNANTARADLHIDILELHVKRPHARKAEHLRYALTMSASPENSARMCQGVPFPQMLENDRSA